MSTSRARADLPLATTVKPVLPIAVDDVVRLRRAHPCGGRDWSITRVGADVGLRCLGCGRRVMLDRRALEGRIVSFVSHAPTPPSSEA